MDVEHGQALVAARLRGGSIGPNRSGCVITVKVMIVYCGGDKDETKQDKTKSNQAPPSNRKLSPHLPSTPCPDTTKSHSHNEIEALTLTSAVRSRGLREIMGKQLQEHG